MIISDLNYLEAVSQETEVIGGSYYYTPGYNFYKNVSANVSTNTTFNSNTNINDVFNKNANINVRSNVTGNSSTFALDNEAQGYNSNTQGALNQLAVAGQYSGQNGVFVAAAN
jgi:hypothetical protein